MTGLKNLERKQKLLPKLMRLASGSRKEVTDVSSPSMRIPHLEVLVVKPQRSNSVTDDRDSLRNFLPI